VKLASGAARAAVTCALVFETKSAMAACAGRPTDPEGYGSYAYGEAEARSFASEHVRVHWATSGTHAATLTSTRSDEVPDTVAYAAEIAEEALSEYAAMGFRQVPSDTACASNGGDEKLDIYLVRFTGGDGLCVAECTGKSCPSFVLVDSTFKGGGYATDREGFRTVVTHELFHAIQNLYKTEDAPFWAEGTAQWALETLHPDLNDFERNLPAFFSDTTRSLDAPPTGVTAGYLYGSAVWPLFLSMRYGQDTIRAIFEVESEGKSPIEATSRVLSSKGSSLAEAFPLFAAWNAATGKFAGTGGYSESARYPGLKTSELADGVSNITSGLSYFVYRGSVASPHQVSLETDASRNRGVLVPLEDGKARVDRAAVLPHTAEGEVLVIVAGTTTKKTDAPFTLRVIPAEASPTPEAPQPTGPSSVTAPEAASDEGCQAASGHSSTTPGAWTWCSVFFLGLLRRVRSRARV
jgi:hypothetical protein